MGGIKDLVGLLFWMDNKSMPAMKAVSNGERSLPKQKIEIMQHLNIEYKASKLNGKKNNNSKNLSKR